MRLILVRHPETLAGKALCYGSSDVDVAPGELERVVAALAGTLPQDAPVYSSPLQRCAQLARRLAATSLTFDSRLAEMDFGHWEMRPWSEIARTEIDAWSADLTGYRPGGGDSVLAMAARIDAFLQHLLRQKHACAIVVCHAGSMRLLLALSRGLPLTQAALAAAGTPHQIAYGAAVIVDL